MDQLLVHQLGDGRLQVGFTRSGQQFDTRSEPAEFQSPLGAPELEDLRWYLEEYLDTPFGVYEERGQCIQTNLAKWGRALFQQVFGPGRPGRDAYMRSRGGQCELVFRSASASFLSLPWELLQDPERAAPLALDLSAVDRSLAVDGDPTTVPTGKTLRVLMVIARPSGASDIGYQMIARPLVQQLGEVRGKVELEVLRPPTLDALERQLNEAVKRKRGYHILHFDGHGSFGDKLILSSSVPYLFDAHASAHGQLSFEAEGGGEHLVSAAQFALAVNHAKVPIVVLNACRAGFIGQAAVEAAVATQLLKGGAASVVAMGYAIYGIAAANFMTAFYKVLFEGKSVSEAVSKGRWFLYNHRERPSPKGEDLPLEDWIVPVHYRRSAINFPKLKRSKAGKTPDEVRDQLTPDREFIGRDSIFYDLESALRWRHVVIVHGAAGMGKTEVAKAFGRWWQKTGGVKHPEHVVLSRFTQGVASFSLDNVLSEIALQVEKVLNPTDNADVRYEKVLKILRENRLLLIWDNFESVHDLPDPNGATPPLSELERTRVRAFLQAVARESQSGVIITSRTRELWLGDFNRLQLGGLGQIERTQMADRLLLGSSTSSQEMRRRDKRSFDDLIEWLGGHPLSMRLVLPHLNEVPATDLLNALKGHAKALPADGGGEGMLESLGASLKYSMDQLGGLHREHVLALSLFESVTDKRVLGIMSKVCFVPNRFSDVGEDQWSALLSRLTAIGVLTSLKNGMYGMHPALPSYLVAEWQRKDSFSAEQTLTENALLSAYAEFSGRLMTEIERGSAEAALTTLDQQRRTMGRVLGRALATQNFGDALRLLEPLALFWDSRGLRQEALGWLDRCEAALEHGLSSRLRLDTAAGSFWLTVNGTKAEWNIRDGKFIDAEQLYITIQDELEKSDGKEREPRLSVVYHQRGLVAQLRGQLDEAEAWYWRAFEIRDRMDYWPGIADSYHQLGIVAQVRGKMEEATLRFQRALEIWKRLDDQLRMAAAYHQFGSVAQQMGKLDDAMTWYDKAREIRENFNDVSGRFASYHQLGTTEQQRGTLDKAEAWFRKSLAIAEKFIDKRGRFASYHHLGMIAERRNKWSEAKAWYLKALNISQELDDRPNMALSYGQLGLLEERQHKPKEAMDWTVRCIALFKTFPDPATGPAPRNLARMTKAYGWPALQKSWSRINKTTLPAAVAAEIARILANDDDNDDDDAPPRLN